MRTRYARVPVVAAPFGLALGGGAEVVLGCQTVRAAAELYVGCVEVGVGPHPGGRRLHGAGGARLGHGHRRSARSTCCRWCSVPFETLARARVSTSAEEARDIGYLRPGDSVSMARETLLADAKQLALGLARAGYRPPPAAAHPRHRRDRAPRRCSSALQQPGRARTRSASTTPRSAPRWRASCRGGDVPAGAPVSEQHILDLEREAFLSLCGEPKTHERIQYMLTTSKPLRN